LDDPAHAHANALGNAECHEERDAYTFSHGYGEPAQPVEHGFGDQHTVRYPQSLDDAVAGANAHRVQHRDSDAIFFGYAVSDPFALGNSLTERDEHTIGERFADFHDHLVGHGVSIGNPNCQPTRDGYIHGNSNGLGHAKLVPHRVAYSDAYTNRDE
jgi:hypothetical protein